MKQLILASNSPRRRELLAQLGYRFTVEPSLFEESARGLSAHDTALAFARGKAEEVFSRFPEAVVLGADTVVECNGVIFGKPKNESHAADMLRSLSAKTHFVYTGFCVLAQGFSREKAVCTEVDFFPLSEELIASYIASGLPKGKAGAYGIQDGWPLVRAIRGSYTNVVGLPTEDVAPVLAEGLGGTLC